MTFLVYCSVSFYDHGFAVFHPIALWFPIFLAHYCVVGLYGVLFIHNAYSYQLLPSSKVDIAPYCLINILTTSVLGLCLNEYNFEQVTWVLLGPSFEQPILLSLYIYFLSQ